MTRRFRVTLLAATAVAGVIAVAAYALTRGPSAEQLLGVSLPPSARVIDKADRAGMFGGDYFVVIELPGSDFQALVRKMGLLHRADLLDHWPAALRAPNDLRSWTVSETNDANTFFGDQRRSTYLVARYERGRMYYKVHVY